jgi:hypothetical protein
MSLLHHIYNLFALFLSSSTAISILWVLFSIFVYFYIANWVSKIQRRYMDEELKKIKKEMEESEKEWINNLFCKVDNIIDEVEKNDLEDQLENIHKKENEILHDEQKK